MKYDKIHKKYHLLTNLKKFASLKVCIQTLKKDPEPLWRKEACNALAVLRICGFRGPKGESMLSPIRLKNAEMQKLAADALQEAAFNDKDPVVKTWVSFWRKHVTPTTLDNIENIFQPAAEPAKK